MLILMRSNPAVFSAGSRLDSVIPFVVMAICLRPSNSRKPAGKEWNKTLLDDYTNSTNIQQ